MSENLMSGNDTTSESTQVIGKRAEDLAARFLEQRGLKILARNFRCRGGEIDLVCRDGKSLVFVEVRLCRNAHYGGPGASITARKQKRVILAARHYLAAHATADSDCRFDCVLLSGSDANAIEWERDAFSES
jgi:putative endonuclease